jgi:FMN phosphatase YigB (HAD superfamily)
MKIGWDSDGVLYRFTKAYHTWMNEAYGFNFDVESEAQVWNWFHAWQSPEDFLRCMDEGVDAGYLFWQGELYEPEIPELILSLKQAGHENYLITHRFSGKAKCPQDATKHFYEEQGVKFDDIIFSKDKTVAKMDVFIEDNVDNYDSLDAAGVKVYLINRPYNQIDDSRRRVSSVKEFVSLIA